MHRSARGALAVLLPLLLIASSARAQAPLPSGFVDAATVVDGLVLDMRYFSEHNFVGEKIDGYESPRCLLSAQAANALAGVQRRLAPRGLGLKVFDCYRPQRAVAHFVRWARKIDDVRRKSEFYPDLDKRVLFKQGYIAEHSGHSRGATVDLTLVRRAGGSELDMGGPFDFFSPKSWPSDRSVSVHAQQNRALLARAMRGADFGLTTRNGGTSRWRRNPFPTPISISRCVEAKASRVTVERKAAEQTSHQTSTKTFPSSTIVR